MPTLTNHFFFFFFEPSEWPLKVASKFCETWRSHSPKWPVLSKLAEKPERCMLEQELEVHFDGPYFGHKKELVFLIVSYNDLLVKNWCIL